jgi:hypothetical protein
VFNGSFRCAAKSECELVKENIKDRIVTEINLPTGDLVITNFFREKNL